MPYQRDHSKEIDTIKTQLAELYAEKARLKLELNKLYKMYDDLHTTVEFLKTRCWS